MDVLRSKVLHGQRAGERIVVHTLPSLLLPSSNFIRTKKFNFVFRFVYYQQIDLPSFSFLSSLYKMSIRMEMPTILGSFL